MSRKYSPNDIEENFRKAIVGILVIVVAFVFVLRFFDLLKEDAPESKGVIELIEEDVKDAFEVIFSLPDVTVFLVIIGLIGVGLYIILKRREQSGLY